MKCLMPLNQRRIIRDAINGKRYVEWGCGGSTVWISENANPLSMLVIEDCYEYAKQVREKIEAKPGRDVRFIWCGAGDNATIGEESAEDPAEYIEAGSSSLADVYLIDGVLRGDCLRALVDAGRPCTVFIHDTQRDWYNEAIQYAIDHGATRTDYRDSSDDYPGCHLTRLEMPGA